ncbi:hypothetical protein IIY66_00620 [Candidatus Saccharibacteria bacterium]|nr:hypothetical protein [Candidatus Saccharibacteria bacterium]
MQEKRTLNDKIEEFNKYMDWFYSDEFNLDEVESRYEKSIGLAKEIRQDLDKLSNKIEVLKEDFTK